MRTFIILMIATQVHALTILNVGSNATRAIRNADIQAINAPEEVDYYYVTNHYTSLNDIVNYPSYGPSNIDLNDIQQDFDAVVFSVIREGDDYMTDDIAAVQALINKVTANGFNQNAQFYLLENYPHVSWRWDWGGGLSTRPPSSQPTKNKPAYYSMFANELASQGIVSDLKVIPTGNIFAALDREIARGNNKYTSQSLYTFQYDFSENGRFVNTTAFIASILETDPTQWNIDFDYWDPIIPPSWENPNFDVQITWEGYQQIVADNIYHHTPEPSSAILVILLGLMMKERRNV